MKNPAKAQITGTVANAITACCAAAATNQVKRKAKVVVKPSYSVLPLDTQRIPGTYENGYLPLHKGCSKTSNPFAGWRSMVTASLQLPHWTASEQMVQRKLCFPAWQDYLKKHAAKKQWKMNVAPVALNKINANNYGHVGQPGSWVNTCCQKRLDGLNVEKCMIQPSNPKSITLWAEHALEDE